MIKIGDRVKVPLVQECGMVTRFCPSDSDEIWINSETDVRIIHGSTIPDKEYNEKGGLVVDIVEEFALVRIITDRENSEGERILQLPWLISDLTIINKSLKQLIGDLE